MPASLHGNRCARRSSRDIYLRQIYSWIFRGLFMDFLIASVHFRSYIYVCMYVRVSLRVEASGAERRSLTAPILAIANETRVAKRV